MTQQFTCSKCRTPKDREDFHESASKDRTRTVTSRCRACRSKSYFEKRYKTVCSTCLEHRRVDKNQSCPKCNELSAMRQCRKCDEVLPVLMMFEGLRKVCRTCRKIGPKSE